MIKSAKEIELMRISGNLTGQVLSAVGAIIKPGISTMDIDTFCDDYITHTLNARPASKGQYGFAYSVNTSVNHVICHGTPSNSVILQQGDILNIDVTVEKNGYIGDSSKMFCVGEVSNHAQQLIEITQQCLYKAIQIIHPNMRLSDIGHTIQTHAEKHGYSVVHEFCGHGIGAEMHEAPQVLHYGKAGKGVKLKPGMIFTIEPMINEGSRHIIQQDDGWNVTTRDGKLSAQWEHTILVTKSGAEVLTLREEEKPVFLHDEGT